MNQKNLKRYLFFFAVLLISMALLFAFFRGFVKSSLVAEQESHLEHGVMNLNQNITAMMDLTGRDFQYLLDNEKTLLFEALEAQSGATGADLFITDESGNILVASTGAPHGKVPDLAVGAATRAARDGRSFLSTLSRLYPSERRFRVVVLEKEFSPTHRQKVGLIFFSLSTEELKNDLRDVTALLAVIFLVMLFFIAWGAYFIFRRIFSPLKHLDEAAEKFAKGNFKERLDEEKSGGLAPLFRTFNQMAETVEQNETARQTFVSNVSHDLRTPLTTISGFMQNIQQGNIPEEKLGHYYNVIIGEVDRLARLVQTLLETSRMTAGKRKYNFAPTDLCELSRLTLLSFEKRLEEKELDVTFFAEPDSILVHADKDAIQQVIYNLLDNAIKFTPEKGRLSIEILDQDKKAYFAVTNSGEGIPEEELANLFDRFYKSDRSRGLDKKGMGLGLFIAKEVISAHGEELWVESKVGSYTQFVFTLPLSPSGKRKIT